ncbi:DPB11 [Candida oxycetoniae]|uniref:DPB11 n=1 Tax=Candida oxycetoniae TaxID=497107 RepID=A0AAI9WYE3_9ASCO|nr:DPB11 [Candida oxycetoniae]KAI3405275.2 DPB11 [Candida oxycetoniae]
MVSKHPFSGLTFCCTGIEAKLRIEISKNIKALGGVEYPDLMTDVQYLIVGKRDTEKYRFCVRNRADITFLTADSIFKIYKRWLMGEEDVQLQLKNHLLPIFSDIDASISRTDITKAQFEQLFTMSHFRPKDADAAYFSFKNLSNIISENGGKAKESVSPYSSCMISADPRGTRYSKALEWGIPVVHPIWVFDSILRGAAMVYSDYQLKSDSTESYDTGCKMWHLILKPQAEVDELKKSNNSNNHRRRLLATRSTATSTTEPSKLVNKLNNREIWNSIMDHTKDVVKKSTRDKAWDEESESEEVNEDIIKPSKLTAGTAVETTNNNLFLGFNFLLMGFDPRESELLSNGIENFSGEIIRDMYDTSISHIIIPARKGSKSSGVLKALPAEVKQKITSGDIKVVTELFIERSIYYKKVVLDSWGQPIKGLMKSSRKFNVCTSGFTGIELLHIEKLIRFMNFEYCDTLSSQRDLLILNVNLFKDSFMEKSPKLFDYKYKDVLNCPVYQSGLSSVSLLSTKNKIEASKKWNIPIVSIGYIWEIFEVSKYKSVLIMPELTNPNWCIYAPINYIRPRSLMDYIKSMSDRTDTDERPRSVNEHYESDAGGSIKLPSPRKTTPKRKYGRLSGGSPQSIKGKLQGAPSREGSIVENLNVSVYDKNKNKNKNNNNDTNGENNKRQDPFDCDITNEDDLSSQVRYEDAESIMNQERLLKKLENEVEDSELGANGSILHKRRRVKP